MHARTLASMFALMLALPGSSHAQRAQAADVSAPRLPPINVDPGRGIGPLRLGMTQAEAAATHLRVRRTETGMVSMIGPYEVEFDPRGRLDSIALAVDTNAIGMQIGGTTISRNESMLQIAPRLHACGQEMTRPSGTLIECFDGNLVLHDRGPSVRSGRYHVEVLSPRAVGLLHVTSDSAVDVHAGSSIGVVHLGMTRDELSHTGLAMRSIGGPLYRAGAFEVELDTQNRVDSIYIRLADAAPGLRINGHTVASTGSAGDLFAAARPCTAGEPATGARNTICANGGLVVSEAGPPGIPGVSVRAPGRVR